MAKVVHKNAAGKHLRKALRSEAVVSGHGFVKDMASALQGECIYHPHMLAGPKDHTLLDKLLEELQSHAAAQLIPWSEHLKHEDPTWSPTFLKIVEELADYFGVRVFATRMNVYVDGEAWKPFHHDSHAYANDDRGNRIKEDFTMGLSLGASRELVFLHPASKQTFSFPQQNGDVFAFTDVANEAFQHGVPRKRGCKQLRVSIIAWGTRSSSASVELKPVTSTSDALDSNVPTIEQLIDSKSLNAPAASKPIIKRRRGVVQGGWANLMY